MADRPAGRDRGNAWPGVFDRLLTALEAHRRAVLVVSVAVFAALGVAGFFIRVDGRVEALVPARDRFLAEHVEALRRLGAAETIQVDVAADDAAARLATASAVAERLRASGLFRNVAGPASADELGRTAAVFGASVPLLLDAADYAEIEARTRPDAVADRVEAVAARLLEPGGEALEASFRRDPLDFAGVAMRASIGRSDGKVATTAGIPASADGRHVLVTATALAPMGDETAGAAIAQVMDAARGAAPRGVAVDWLGGHRFYGANAAAVRRDVALVSTLGLVFVLAVVSLSFRGVRSTALAALASVVGCAVGAAAAAVCFGSVSGVALAFGGALSGICVDYVLHLRAAAETGETAARAVHRTYVAVAPSVAVGGVTSAAAFLLLLASGVEAHRQIGVISAAAILGAVVFALVPAPLLAGPAAARDGASVHREVMDRASGVVWRRLVARPRAALVAGCVLVVASLCALPALQFEPDLRRFEFKNEATLSVERDFARTWGNVLSPSLLVVRADDADGALRVTEDVLVAAAADGAQGPQWPAASRLVPSLRTQDERRRRWAGFWTTERREALRRDLAAAARATGLSPTAFDPFLASLDAVPAALTASAWDATALRPLVERLLVRTESQVWSVVPVPRDAAELRDERTIAAVRAAGASVLGGRTLAAAVAESTRSELVTLALPAVVVVGGLLWLYYREAWRSALALLPLLGGLAVAGAGLVACGEPLSLMTLPVVVPTLGFAVDYGIFTIDAMDEAAADPRNADRLLERRGGGVLSAALTTVAGGVAMLVANHPAVRAIGIAMVLAATSCLVVAWLVLPGLHRLGGRRR